MARVSFKIRLNLDGLVPDPFEFDPCIVFWTSFGNGRFGKKTSLTPVQQRGDEPVELVGCVLPPLKELRGDEMICFNIFAETRLSGMPDLDAINADYATYTATCGLFDVSLETLLHAAVHGTALQMPIRDPRLREIFSSDKASTKGEVESLEVTVVPRDSAAAYATRLEMLRRRSERDPSQPLLLGTQRWSATAKRGEAAIARHYGNAFLGTPENPAPYRGALNASCAGLHLPFFVSERGTTLPMVYFSSRNSPMFRAPGSTMHETPDYLETHESRAFYNETARNIFASVGLSEKGAIAALGRQLDAPAGTTEIYPMTVRALEGTSRFLQAFGNSLQYRSDMRTPSAKYLAEQAASGERPRETFRSRKQERCANAFHKHYFAGKDGAADAPDINQMCESMDSLGVAGVVNDDDCEGSADPPKAVYYDILPPGRNQVGIARLKDHPLLFNMARMLERFDAAGIGASATNAFYDPRAHKENVTYMGHIYDRVTPVVHVNAWAANGGINLKERVPEFFNRTAADGTTVTQEPDAWEPALPPLLVEGTSGGSPFVMPAAEVHPSYATQTQALRELGRAVNAAGAPPATPPGAYYSTIGTVFNIKDLPKFDATPADKSARLSDFYHAEIHYLSPKLAELDPRLSQFAFVDTSTNTRGVLVDKISRLSPDVGLYAPYVHMSDAELKDVIDVGATIKNTQPAMVMARFPPIAKEDEASSLVSAFGTTMLRVSHPLSDASVAALSDLKLPKRPSGNTWAAFHSALDNHSAGIRKRAAVGYGNNKASSSASVMGAEGVEKLQEHLDRPDRAILSMTTPAWRLANADMRKIDSELKELYDKGHIVGHAFWRDRFLQQCPDQVTLALVVDTTKQ